MFALAEDWVWDSWVADDGELYHLFFLHAPRALGDPGLRHEAATIGHATSPDLIGWTYVGNALEPDPDGWDDLALWTGSVVRGDDGTWRMFYTALNTHGGHGTRDQRIGVAESDDLTTWTRVLDRPVVEVDGRWYKTLPEDPTASETWRDPFVFRDGDGWRMLITARAVGAPADDDGVLALASSTDLVHWQVGPPVTDPGAGFGQLEVAQVHVVDGRPVLVFTCHPQEQTASRVARAGRFSTWSVTGATDLAGPWDIATAQPFEAEPHLFAAPLVQRRDGSWVMLGFRNLEPEGILSFDIVDPVPVEVGENGVQRRPPAPAGP